MTSPATVKAAAKKKIGTKKTYYAYLLDKGFKYSAVTATMYSNHTATAKAPSIAGYKKSTSTIDFQEDKQGYLNQVSDLFYEKSSKKFAYKFASLKSQKTKSSKYVKVTGNIKILNKKLAKKHKASVVYVRMADKEDYIKLNKKGSFSKTIKSNETTDTVAIIGYYSNKGKIFHALSSGSQVIIKPYKQKTTHSVKKYAYKLSTLKSQRIKSKQATKITGKVLVANKSLAKEHRATYVRITNNNTKKYIKLSKKNTFNKTIKSQNAKHISVVVGYYTKKNKVKTFHTVSASKQVVVKQSK